MAVRAAALSPVVGGALLLATAFPLEASRGAPATAASGVVCNGKERWDIKTL